MSVQLARTELAQSYEVGLIQQTPTPDLSEDATAILARLARRAWSLKRALDTNNETSHAFLLPPGLNEKATALDYANVERELATILREIDEAAYTLYGIDPEDRAVIETPSNRAVARNDNEDEDVDEDNQASEDESPVDLAASGLNSWLVGVAFGRFDPRLATGDVPPPEPGPFDLLPSRSPGMWPEGEETARSPTFSLTTKAMRTTSPPAFAR